MTNDEKNAALDLLQDILNIPSVNSFSRETAVAEYLQQYFSNFGIESELQYVDEKRSNIIADIEGENPDVLHIWNGHIDTVPYGNIEEWSTDPGKAVVVEDRLYARGTSDMKSGLAAMVYSLCMMKAEGRKPPLSIRFIGTCDEEKGGQGALKVIETEKLGSPSLMLIGEPTDCNIGIAQKGCLWLKLVLRGKTSHGAYPDKGVNAIQNGFDICSDFKEKLQQYSHPLLKNPTAEITSISGGIAPNMIPDFCELTMDVRIIPGLDVMETLNVLEQICRDYEARFDQRLKVECSVLNKRPPVNTAADNKHVLQLKEFIEKHGMNPEMLGINYFTDASVFIEDYSEMAVLLFGPGCPDMAHKPDEYVEIEKYYSAIEVLKSLYFANESSL